MDIATGRVAQPRGAILRKSCLARPSHAVAPARPAQLHERSACVVTAATLLGGLPKAMPAQPLANPPATPAVSMQERASNEPDLAATFAGGVQSMFDCLNRRDLVALADRLSLNAVYQNTSEGAMHSGRDRVVTMYRDLMSKVPSQAKLIIDDLLVSEGLSMVDVTWHVELGGIVLPMSRGTSIYWLSTDGVVTRIRDSTEVPMLLALQALSVASLALDAAVPLLPSLQSALAAAGVLGSQAGTTPAPVSSSMSGIQAAGMSGIQAAGMSNIQAAGMSNIQAGNVAQSQAQAQAQAQVQAQAQAAPLLSLPMLPSLPNLPFLGWPQQSGGTGSAGASTGAGDSAARSASTSSAASKTKAWDSGREIPMRTLSPSSPLATGTTSAAASRPQPSTGTTSTTTTSTTSTATSVTATANAKSWGRIMAPANHPGPRAMPEGGSTLAATPLLEAPVAVTNLSGVWAKDLEASDATAYEGLLDLLGLSGLQRVTARLIEGMEIQHVPGESFDVSYLTVVPFFRVTESTQIGFQTTMMRRDLKPGQQRAVAEELPGGEVRVSFDWGAPNAGALQETYVLEGDRMSMLCNLVIGNRRATALLVYKRMQGGADELLRQSRERNSSLDVVLARQRAQWGWK